MPRIPLLVIAFFFITSGISHFVVADFFIMAMPDYLGYHKELVIISGIFEILGAIGILVPQSRLLAGYGLIALIVAVYPANINMALHPEKYNGITELFLYIRLPFQFLFIWFVWWAITPERVQNKHAST
ncbi:MAG: DoxX family protein [Gammaproteobacteria bacterium]|nr:DoxX family protein [Gammaproteobacteria bacterium]